MSAVKISAEEVVGIVPPAFAYEEGAGVVDVGPVVVEHGGVLMPVTRADASVLVGAHVDAVECLGNGEHPPVEVEEGSGVLFLLQIKSFVGLVILSLDGIEQHGVDTYVVAVGRVLEQLRHQLLGLCVVFVALLQISPCLRKLFLLSPRQARHCDSQKQQ